MTNQDLIELDDTQIIDLGVASEETEGSPITLAEGTGSASSNP